ncbi:MAG: tetratricopeptide repeat protein [Neisseriaceae bacterium]|nr:tetratricopeptide repeat protein [Neisseriaceae bacterium]
MLVLVTSFFLSACASQQPFSAVAQTAPLTPLSAQPPIPPADAITTLSATLAQQQTRLDDLEQALTKLQAQVDGLTPPVAPSTPSAPTAPSEAIPTKPHAVTDQSIHQQALSQFQQQDYVAMVGLLKAYANGGNGSQAAQGNMFLLSAAHFQLGNCETAINIGRRFANDYKQHPDAPKALYNMANCQLGMKQNDVAKTTLRNLIRTYPNSKEAQRAKILLQ